MLTPKQAKALLGFLTALVLVGCATGAREQELVWLESTLDYLVANPTVAAGVDPAQPYRDLRRHVRAAQSGAENGAQK